MGWEGLPGIDAVRPLDERDQAVIDAVREVLGQHGALERFRLTPLHSHFELAPDELMVEIVDGETRTLVTRPMRLDTGDGASRLIATSFRLDNPGGAPIVCAYCFRPPGSDLHET